MDDLSAGEKIIVVFLTALLAIGGIVTLRSQIVYGSPVAVFGINASQKKQPAAKPAPVSGAVFQEVTASVTEKLNMRPSPSNENTPIKVLEAGTKVRVLSVENGWAKIIDNTDTEGYASIFYLSY